MTTLPPLAELRASARVVSIPLRVRFRGVTHREALLLQGPAGWGELSPFLEYAAPEASRWLAANGLLGDAVRHAIAGGDDEHAADLVELALADLRRRRQDRILRDWLGALPDDVVRRRPLLALFMGWSRLSEGDFDGVEAWLDAAEAGLDTAPPSTIGRPQTSVIAATLPCSPRQASMTSSHRSSCPSGFASAVSAVKSAVACSSVASPPSIAGW